MGGRAEIPGLQSSLSGDQPSSRSCRSPPRVTSLEQGIFLSPRKSQGFQDQLEQIMLPVLLSLMESQGFQGLCSNYWGQGPISISYCLLGPFLKGTCVRCFICMITWNPYRDHEEFLFHRKKINQEERGCDLSKARKLPPPCRWNYAASCESSCAVRSKVGWPRGEGDEGGGVSSGEEGLLPASCVT